MENESFIEGQKEALKVAEELAVDGVVSIAELKKALFPVVRKPRMSAEKKALVAEKEHLQSIIDVENSMIYTLQQDPYNRGINNRRITGLRRGISNLRKKITIVEEPINSTR